MSLFPNFHQYVTDLQDSHSVYYLKYATVVFSPRISIFKPTFDKVYNLFAESDALLAQIVNELHLKEAFNNHNLQEPTFMTQKVLGSVKRNPTQWENAFAKEAEAGNPRISGKIDRLKGLNNATTALNKNMDMLANADWQVGTICPSDILPKLVHVLKAGMYDYLAFGSYDPEVGLWQIDGKPAGTEIEVKEWTNTPTVEIPV